MKIPATHRKQHGVVIVVALVMLLGMTVLSVTSMTNSTLEEKMSANLRDREIAFQAAEAALRRGERIAATFTNPQYTQSCTNGLCESDLQDPDTNRTYTKYWTDPTIWNTTGKHKVYNITFAEDGVSVWRKLKRPQHLQDHRPGYRPDHAISRHVAINIRSLTKYFLFCNDSENIGIFS